MNNIEITCSEIIFSLATEMHENNVTPKNIIEVFHYFYGFREYSQCELIYKALKALYFRDTCIQKNIYICFEINIVENTEKSLREEKFLMNQIQNHIYMLNRVEVTRKSGESYHAFRERTKIK